MRSHGFHVDIICQVLTQQGYRVTPRTYRAWKHPGLPSPRQISDESIIAVLTTMKGDPSHGISPAPEVLYGRRKMTRWLRRNGFPTVAFCTVDRLMRLAGMNGVVRAKSIKTTIQAKDGVRAGDLCNRDFHAEAPNIKIVADFTYVRTWSGLCYVAFVVDCFAQRIVGWNISWSKATPLVLTAIQMVTWIRAKEGHPHAKHSLLHHSDAGSQYTSIKFTEHLELEGIKPSIGSVGDAYDNALMESVIGLYKAEALRSKVFHNGALTTLTDVEKTTGEWVWWWNHQRLHSSIGYQTPIEAEEQYYNQHIQLPASNQAA